MVSDPKLRAASLTVHIEQNKEIPQSSSKEDFPYAEIWSDKNYNVYRTAEENPRGSLTWMFLHNGEVVLGRNAEGETQYKYFRHDKGTYVVYLTDLVDGQYRVISNVITYTIE